MRALTLAVVIFLTALDSSSCRERKTGAGTTKNSDFDIEEEAARKAMRDAGLTEVAIKEKLEEFAAAYAQDPKAALSQGIWVLGASDIDAKTGISTDVIRAVLDRKKKANQAIAASVGVCVLGIALAFTPLPGAQGVGLLLIKDGFALAVVYYSLSAETKYREGLKLEVKDLARFEPDVQNSLNSIVNSSAASKQVGMVTKVHFSTSNFIEFETSEGFRFVSKDVAGPYDAIFVSRSKNWLSTLPEENDRVLSLIDGNMISMAKYVERDSHMWAAQSNDYQQSLQTVIDLLASWKTATGVEKIPQELAPDANRVGTVNVERYRGLIYGDLDNEIAGAKETMLYAKTQLGTLGGRIYQRRDSNSWERFQSHLRALDIEAQAILNLKTKDDTRTAKIRLLMEIYARSRPIIAERAQYLQGRTFEPGY